jgi:hypothetical protein
MANIIIKMKDGSVKSFQHEGRAGGGYTKTLKLEHGFAIVTDEWDKRTIIPSADISEIEETPSRSSW